MGSQFGIKIMASSPRDLDSLLLVRPDYGITKQGKTLFV